MQKSTFYLSAIAAGILAFPLLLSSSLLAATPTAFQIKNLTADGSIQAYCRDIRINTIVVPDFCSLLARAEKQYSQGNLQGAVQSYDRALEMNPKYALAYYNRGVCRYKLGDKQGAIGDVARAKDMLLAAGDRANFESSLATLKQMQQS